MDFIAFDFETANAKRNSACSLALTVVRNDQIVDELYSLIDPRSQFSSFNTKIHGLSAKDTANAPTFAELWPHICSFFKKDSLVVAHNAPFDCSVLNKTLESYDLQTPEFLVLDTVKTSRKFYQDLSDHKLNTICDHLNIDLKQHHNALFDSNACAKILLHQINEFGPEVLRPFIKEYRKK